MMVGDSDTVEPTSARAFVALVGPDGVGKTTLAAELLEHRGGETQYVHFRPRLGSKPDSRPVKAATPEPKLIDAGASPLGWLRITRSLFVFWAGYLVWIRPALRRGALVVADRWIYGYLAQPAALGFGGPDWLARLVCRLAPQPDLVVRLTAPAAVIARRKQDLSLEAAASEDQVWASLAHIDMVISGQANPTESARRILDRIGS